jgi:hypothetical protein
MKSMNSVSELKEKILAGELGTHPKDMWVTGASYIYQTTQFPLSETKYHNYYLLVRVESYFGSCCHIPEQLDISFAEKCSGRPLDTVIEDVTLPVQIAAMDGYLGVIYPHEKNCSSNVSIPAGTPIQKAEARDKTISQIANIEKGQKVALIGVVNPLVKAIKEREGICLPCDLQLRKTQWNEAVEKDMEKVLDKADNVICTAMTLSNGTFDRILEVVRNRNIPLTVYAQTGSAVVAQFVGNGVTNLIAEPFPFTQFSASSSELYCYTTI